MVTNPTPLVLRSSSGNLILSLDEKGVGGWCQVHLEMPGIRRPLGAERLRYVATHLASFLAESSSTQRWVFSLSELHTSAYGEHVDGEAIIHLQDADAKMFAKLVLTPTERTEWIETLSQYADSPPA